MGASDLSKPDFPALLERAESKYAAWYLKELRPERDRRLNELKKQRLTSGGRAIYAFQIYRELLERAVRQRLDFYSAVARESSNSGMLAKPRLDEFRQPREASPTTSPHAQTRASARAFQQSPLEIFQKKRVQA